MSDTGDNHVKADPPARMGRSALKRAAIIEAAEKLFLNKGFDSASMDEIAETAGVSKRTVYSHFGSKEEMFVGLLESKCGGVRENFVSTVDDDAPIEKSLHDLGCDFLAMIFRSETIKLFRILAAQADNFPDLGRSFYECGPERSTESVAEYLAGQAKRGIIDIDDPVLAAHTLMSSMMNKRLTACLLKAAELPNEAEREQMVSMAVSMFLDGVRVRT